MKIINHVLLCVLLIVAEPLVDAQIPADAKHNRAVQLVALELIRGQRIADAREYMRANIRTGTSADDRAMALVECAVDIVFQFRHERKQQLAKDACTIAFEGLRPYLEGRPAPARCAGIFASLGVVCEDTFYDLAAAKAYYQAALALEPRDKLTAKRLAQVQTRLAAQPAAPR